MDIDTYCRKVQSLFGDEHEFLITLTDLIDWLNDGMTQIVRETGCSITVANHAANLFPLTITNLFLVHRLQFGSTPLVFTSLSEIDDLTSLQQVGTPNSYYLQGGVINLHPTPPVGTITPVSVMYSPAPPVLTTSTPGNTPLNVCVPEMYHEDLVIFALSRAHEKNENVQLSRTKMEEFNGRVTQRRYEAQHGQSGPSYKRVDPMDFDWREVGW